MNSRFEIDAAVHLWHERVGRFLGDYAPAKSLGGAYPMKTAKGPVRLLRIGSGAPCAILIDGEQAVVVESLSVPDIPGLQNAPVHVMARDPACSLDRGVMDWALDPARIFPLLIVLPGKASALSALRLSRLATEVSICAPGSTLTFDATKVRSARERLESMGKEGRDWRAASRLRAAIATGDYLRNRPEQANRLLKDYAQSKEVFPLSLWLPTEGEPEYEALGRAMIASKPGLPIHAFAGDRN